MNPTMNFVHEALHAAEVVFLLLCGLVLIPLAALAARFMMVTVLAIIVVLFVASCFSPRLQKFLDHLGQ